MANTASEKLISPILQSIGTNLMAIDQLSERHLLNPDWKRLRTTANQLLALRNVLGNTKLLIIRGQLHPLVLMETLRVLQMCKKDVDNITVVVERLQATTKDSRADTADRGSENLRCEPALGGLYSILVNHTQFLSHLRAAAVSDNNLPQPVAESTLPRRETDPLGSSSAFHHAEYDGLTKRSPPAPPHTPTGTTFEPDEQLYSNTDRFPKRKPDGKGSVGQSTGSTTRNLQKINTGVKGPTELFAAARRGQDSTVQFLLEEGADVNDGGYHDTTSAWSPLCTAAKYGHESTVRLLLDHRANVHAADHTGWTAIGAASKAGHVGIVKLLLEHGADVSIGDEKNWTSLHTASMHGRGEVVRVLLDWGADVRVKDSRGRTPTLMAIREDHEAIVRLLKAYEHPQPPPSYETSVMNPRNPSHDYQVPPAK